MRLEKGRFRLIRRPRWERKSWKGRMDVSGCWEEMNGLTREEGYMRWSKGGQSGSGHDLPLDPAVRARGLSGRVNVAAAWLAHEKSWLKEASMKQS